MHLGWLSGVEAIPRLHNEYCTGALGVPRLVLLPFVAVLPELNPSRPNALEIKEMFRYLCPIPLLGVGCLLVAAPVLGESTAIAPSQSRAEFLLPIAPARRFSQASEPQPTPETPEAAAEESESDREEEPVEELLIIITEQLLNQPLYAPFRREGTVRESTRPAYVVTKEQIEAQDWKTVDEALRYLPGVLSEGTAGGQLGALSGQFLRGGNSAQTLVLLDGRPINDTGFLGGFDLSAFTTDAIAQIEVVPGGGSTLYGSDAVGGVINLVTRIPAEPGVQIRPSLEFGSFGYDRQGLQITGRTGDVGFALGYTQLDSESDFPFSIDDGQFRFSDPVANAIGFEIEGDRDNADVLYNNAHAKIEVDLGDRNRLTFNGLLLNKDLGIASGVPIPVAGSTGEFNTLTSDFRQDTREWLLDLTWQSQLGKAGREDESVLTAKVFLDDLQFETTNPDGFTVADRVDRRNLGFQVQHDWQIARNQNLTYGADYRNVDARNQTTLAAGDTVENYDGNLNQGALFVRYQVDFGERLRARAGLRQDFNSTAEGSFTSPEAGIRWDVTGTTALRANVSRSFRAPLISDLEGLAAFDIEGNPDLEPERGFSFDVGFDQQLGDRGLLRFTYFFNEIDNAIAFEFGSPSTFRNIGRVRTVGIETALNFQVAKNVFLLANYTLNDPIIRADAVPALEGNALSFRGADVLNFGLSYENPKGLFVGAFLRNVSDRFTNNTNTEALQAYTTVDLKARIPIGRQLAIHASWNNIFNEGFQEFPGFPGLGSNFRAGVSSTF